MKCPVHKTMIYVSNMKKGETPECAAFFHLAHHFKLTGYKLVNTYQKVLDLIELQETVRVRVY